MKSLIPVPSSLRTALIRAALVFSLSRQTRAQTQTALVIELHLTAFSNGSGVAYQALPFFREQIVSPPFEFLLGGIALSSPDGSHHNSWGFDESPYGDHGPHTASWSTLAELQNAVNGTWTLLHNPKGTSDVASYTFDVDVTDYLKDGIPVTEFISPTPGGTVAADSPLLEWQLGTSVQDFTYDRTDAQIVAAGNGDTIYSGDSLWPGENGSMTWTPAVNLHAGGDYRLYVQSFFSPVSLSSPMGDPKDANGNSFIIPVWSNALLTSEASLQFTAIPEPGATTVAFALACGLWGLLRKKPRSTKAPTPVSTV